MFLKYTFWLICVGLACVLDASPVRLSENEARSWAIIPVALVNPENGYGGGLKYLDRTWLGPGRSLEALFYYTAKHQGKLDLEFDWQRADGWGMNAAFALFYYPESFFGFTNFPRDEDEHIFTPKGGSWEQEISRRLFGSVSVKAQYQVKAVRMESVRKKTGGAPDDAVLDPQLIGREGGWSDLFFLGVEFDSRDFEKIPSQGWYAGHKAGHSLLPGDFRYGWTETWLARYATFRRHWEWSGKVFSATALGEAPFYEMPYLGDKRRLRGVPEKRLRHRSIQAMQSEVRYQFYLPFLPWEFQRYQWQFAMFGEVGRAGPGMEWASAREIHYSGGVGGRMILGNRLACLRGDLGFSQYGYGLYIDFGQAF